jgi:hypothetical protein
MRAPARFSGMSRLARRSFAAAARTTGRPAPVDDGPWRDYLGSSSGGAPAGRWI